MKENTLEPWLSFLQAMDAIIDGQRVTRAEWKDKRHYCLLKDDLLQLHKAGESENETHPWIVSINDMDGEDWIIL